MNTTEINNTIRNTNTVAALEAIIKKAEWMKEEIARNERLVANGKWELAREATLRASDFDDLSNYVRYGFNSYTR